MPLFWGELLQRLCESSPLSGTSELSWTLIWKLRSQPWCFWKPLTAISRIHIDWVVYKLRLSTASAFSWSHTWTKWGLYAIPCLRKSTPRRTFSWNFPLRWSLDVRKVSAFSSATYVSTQWWFCAIDSLLWRLGLFLHIRKVYTRCHSTVRRLVRSRLKTRRRSHVVK